MRLLIFSLTLLLTCSCTPGNKGKKLSFPDLAALDGEATMEIVKKQLSFGPRHVNSDGAKKCAKYIAKFAEDLGYNVKIDLWAEGSGKFSRVFRNIICTKAGKGNQFVLAGSHYDTKILPNFVGANDGASSTAVLMAVMKQLAQNEKWNHHCGMRFVFFDGEEAIHNYSAKDGLNGSMRYARQLSKSGDARNCRAMLLMDMVGDKSFKLTIPSNSSEHLIKMTEDIAKHLKYQKHVSRMKSDGFHDDHKPFLMLGIPAIDLIDFKYGPPSKKSIGGAYWHTPKDTIDKLSADSLAKCGLIFKHLLWQVSNNPLINKK